MLAKKEQIWRYILEKTLTKERILEFEQKEIAKVLRVSTSTVFNALKVPRQSGAVEVRGRGFFVRDIEKLLTLWATQRSVKKDILYETRVNDTVVHIESSMPASVVFGAYTAYKFRFKDVPADYDKVVVYADRNGVEEIKKRFPHTKGFPNVIVLSADPMLTTFGGSAPNSQVYVDLWNLPQWYARDFLKALRKQLRLDD